MTPRSIQLPGQRAPRSSSCRCFVVGSSPSDPRLVLNRGTRSGQVASRSTPLACSHRVDEEFSKSGSLHPPRRNVSLHVSALASHRVARSGRSARRCDTWKIGRDAASRGRSPAASGGPRSATKLGRSLRLFRRPPVRAPRAGSCRWLVVARAVGSAMRRGMQ